MPPEYHAGAIGNAVAEAPAKHEVKAGAPLRGPSGWELNDALGWAGRSRSDLNYHNVLACQIPKLAEKGESDFTIYMRSVSKRGLANPITCCAPRLHTELAATGLDTLLTLGDVATKTLLRTTKGIMSMRGGPRMADVLGDGSVWRVLPTFHPAHVLRNQHLREWFYADIGRAFRHFTNTLETPRFDIVYPGHPRDLEAFLADPRQAYWGFDIETTKKKLARNIRPLETILRCYSVAKGDGSAVMVVPVLSVDGHTRFYSEAHIDGFRQVLMRAFAEDRLWVGHNSRWFDQLWFESHGYSSPARHDDTMVLHQQAWPAMKHKLKVVGTTLLDMVDWKTNDDDEDNAIVDEAEFEVEDDEDEDEIAAAQTAAQTKDEDLWVRNATDSIVTVLAAPKIVAKVVERYPDPRLPIDPSLTIDDLTAHAQFMCRGFHRVGMWVDQPTRARAETWLTHQSADLLAQIKAEAFAVEGLEDFKPSSSRQLSNLLYDRWKLVPREWSRKTGERSASSKAIRLHILDDKLPKPKENLLYLIMRWKKVYLKWLRSTVAPLAPELWKVSKRGIRTPLPTFLSPDGRVRASWNATGTMVLRYSADKPALQIIPKDLRPIFQAEPGRLYAGADAAQMHPRIVAVLWGVARLQEAFLGGEDPYGIIAEIMFGRLYMNASGYVKGKKPKGGQAKKLRDVAKTIFLAMLYGASVDTVHKTVTKAEDPVTGKIAMADVSYRMVQAACDAIHAAMPEIRQGWERMAAEAEENGYNDGCAPYLRDPGAGWRRDFPEGVRDPHGNISSDVINFKVLTLEAVLMHLSEMQLVKVYPFEKWGPGTGFVCNVHDALTAEVPAELAPKVAGDIADALTYTWNGMKFEGEASHGPTLLEG